MAAQFAVWSVSVVHGEEGGRVAVSIAEFFAMVGAVAVLIRLVDVIGIASSLAFVVRTVVIALCIWKQLSTTPHCVCELSYPHTFIWV